MASHPRQICVVPPCGNLIRVKSRGWCQACYEWWRQGKGEPVERFTPRATARTCTAEGCIRTFRSATNTWCVPCRRWSARHDGADPGEKPRQGAPEGGCVVVETGQRCGKPVFTARHGWCHMHHTRWKRHGDPLTRHVSPNTNSLESIAAQAAAIAPDSNGCRISTGTWGGDKDGYPVTRLNGKRRRVTHLVLETAMGRPLASGEWGLHHCDVPPCVELTHLFAGTHEDNVADMVAKGRKPLGEDVVTAELMADQVRTIRHDYARHAATQGDLAERYGVGQTTISRIVRRVSWAHIE